MMPFAFFYHEATTLDMSFTEIEFLPDRKKYSRTRKFFETIVLMLLVTKKKKKKRKEKENEKKRKWKSVKINDCQFKKKRCLRVE